MQAQQVSSLRTTITTAREKVKKFPSDRVDIVVSASVTIPDTSGMLHSFSENQTSLETELRVHKRDLVRVDGEDGQNFRTTSLTTLMTGDCCISIYSEREGAGQLQTFQSDGEHHLEMDVLRSLYVLECVR